MIHFNQSIYRCIYIIFLSINSLCINAQSIIHTCIDKYPSNIKHQQDVQRGMFNFSVKWPNGTRIKVKFSGGSQYVRSKVIYYAKFWENYANIKFDFISYGLADILISFKKGGSWSQVGINSRLVSYQELPSMNFGWFNDYTPEFEFRRTVLHEFGHALGLLHEHQNPYGNIKWNYPVVYNHYYLQGWSKKDVDQNIFRKYQTTLSNYQYDKYSIMHYPIPAKFTINGFSVGWKYPFV